MAANPLCQVGETATKAGTRRAIHLGMNGGRQQNQILKGGTWKSLLFSLGKILPAAFLVGVLSGCQTSTVSAEGSHREPVVAPAGTVLRVRLDQTLASGRSRPGDRFIGTLDSPVTAGEKVIFPKGAIVEGHVSQMRSGSRAVGQAAELALALDSCERGGAALAVDADTVTRIGAPHLNTGNNQEDATSRGFEPVSLPADSIVGFTLRKPLTIISPDTGGPR